MKRFDSAVISASFNETFYFAVTLTIYIYISFKEALLFLCNHAFFNFLLITIFALIFSCYIYSHYLAAMRSTADRR